MAKNQGDRCWRVLTRRDLSMFDDAATDVVHYAMERGGVGRVSSNGHGILRSQSGQTMSVTRNSNKSKQVVAIKVRRIFGEES